ncbi:hypothetical protein [Actinopolymorpha pittospori]|uniref:Uncharacterized protein n=1 Tax=Actinopolymorpha pittospori TaxID=648752 RepID=A0A927MZM1_9ACTN|nr:hypothetical protein [Actinopolymorpha pittospori]MBE1609269.1 hypothetical protein [Actinopolymorpha pittospori]
MKEGGTNRSPALEDATAQDWLGSNQDPDVLLSVPDLGVDRISLNVEDLEADVDLHARVLDVVELHVGAKVTLGRVDLEIENVHAQAMLKVKLDKVAEIVDRVLETIESNPEIVTSLTTPIGKGVEELGRGAGQGVRELGSSSPTSDERQPIETAHNVEYDEADRDAEAERDDFDQDEAGRDEFDRDESAPADERHRADARDGDRDQDEDDDRPRRRQRFSRSR